MNPQTSRPYARLRPPSGAFTLVEILVVIAIIGILAAILFPVFARAREGGRRSACQSNMKQLGLALQQYVQDYRGKVPPVNYNADASYSGLRTWISALQPYAKSSQIARCPSQKLDPRGAWGSAGDVDYQTRWPSYAFNYFFLNPNNCEETPDGSDWVFTPIGTSRVQKPSETVAFTEAKIVGDEISGYYHSYRMNAPGMTGAGVECTYNNSGWGVDTNRDDPADGQVTSTGTFDPRHFGGANVAFLDGHVKWMTPGALAAGTNWAVGMKNSDVRILDRSQYLWDTR